MATPRLDPYKVLGVRPTASDAEVRAAYRKLVQLHHPDHNGGSAVSARRFEEVQEAYAQVRKRRDGTTGPLRGSTAGARRTPPRPPRPSSDSPPNARLADMEREIREAHLARERARQAAREAAAQSYQRPSDEDLGYVKTDDSLGKILADARSQASERFAEVKEPVAKRVADLLDDIAAKLNGDGPPRPRE